jgi:hypothetical protein
MKRLITMLATAVLLATALVVPTTVSANSPTCGIYPELRAYADNSYVGLLGIQCPQFTTEGVDVNFGDSTDAFRGSDNDSLDSWRFYNPTSSTWCLLFHTDTGFGGSDLGFTLAGNTNWSGWNVGTFHDRISSVEFWKKTSTGCP